MLLVLKSQITMFGVTYRDVKLTLDVLDGDLDKTMHQVPIFHTVGERLEG